MLHLGGQDAAVVYLETPRRPINIGSVGIHDPSTAPGGFVRYDLDAEMTPRAGADDWKAKHMPKVADLLAHSYFNALLQPMRVVETIRRSLPPMAKPTSSVTRGDVSIVSTRMAPRTRLNAKVSAHRVFAAAPVKLADIRAIKDAVPGATVNDVILAIVDTRSRKPCRRADGGVRGIEGSGTCSLPRTGDQAGIRRETRGTAEEARRQGARHPEGARSMTDKIRDTFEKMAEPAKKATEAMRDAGGRMAESSSTVGLKMLDQAEANTREAFTAMRAAAGAKDLTEVMRIQGDFIREQSSRSMGQAREIGELIMQFGRDAVGAVRGEK